MPDAPEAPESEVVVRHAGRPFRFVHSDPADHIFRTLEETGGFYEPEILEVMAGLLRPGELMVDAGANIGNHTVFAAGVCGARVVAFEPNRAAARLLRRNIEGNGLTALAAVEPVALGAAPGRGRQIQPSAHNLGMGRIAPDGDGDVTILTLDGYGFADRVRFLKVDVEGMELGILKGAAALIERDRPAIAVEAAERQAFLSIAAHLGAAGYAVAGSYNWTPTHLFLHAGEPSAEAAGRAVREGLALASIDGAKLRELMQRQTAGLQQQIADLANRLAERDPEAGPAGPAEAGPPADLGETLRGISARLDAAAAARENDRRSAAGLLRVVNRLGDGLAARTEAIRADVAALASALAANNAATAGLGARADEHSARLGDLARRSERIGSRVDLVLEAGLLSAAALEADLGLLKAELAASLTRQLAADRRALGEGEIARLGRDLAEALGRQFADFQVEMERRMDGPATREAPFDPATGEARPAEPGDGGLPPPRSDPAGSPAPDNPASVWYVRRPPVGNAAPGAGTPAEDGADARFGAGPDAPAEAAAGEAIAAETFSGGWAGKGWAQGAAALLPDGLVAATDAGGTFGFVSRRFDFAGGGLVEIDVEARVTAGTDLRPVLRIRSEEDEGVGPDFPLQDGVTSVRAFAPARARQLKLAVLGEAPEAGAAFRVAALRIRRGDPDLHRERVRGRIPEPILASLASIPSRREMLRDCVASLLVQCDAVRVFLNGYPGVPDFLDHPRIEVRRSGDWDDRGDAGKMFWIDRDGDRPGYRLVVDDDLVFPPDFAEVMCGRVAASGKAALVAAHGVLLRQPIGRYYETASRAATFHFGQELAAERLVHVGATNALCFHSGSVDLRWSDFMYCNSADLWLALYANRKRLPVLTPRRPRHWIRENRHLAAGDTIYRHSLGRSRSRFDSSLVQDAVLRHAAPLTVTVRDRPKWGVAFFASDPDALAEAIQSWRAARPPEVEWVVILVFDHRRDDLARRIAMLAVAHETHLVDERGDPAAAVAAVLRLRAGLDLGRLYAVADHVRFGAGEPVVEGPRRPCPDGGVEAAILTGADDGSTCGFVLSLPAPASGPPERAPAMSAARGSALPAALRRAFETAGAAPVTATGTLSPAVAATSVNGLFERVLVLNLDRRPDRWAAVEAQLAAAGIAARRVGAVDGQEPGVLAEYEAYAARPPVTVSPEMPEIRYSEDLYMRYLSQRQRIAHLEAGGKGKAIGSAGAWGYLRSYEAILEQALADQVERLLVFDDDVQLHRDLPALFAAALRELPPDWLILQLGTLQYNWSPPWAERRTPMLYQTNGSAIGSHAVGMRFEVVPFLLDHVKRMDMPFDIGALSAATRAFADRCFVIQPNLAIQRLADSDINTSAFQKGRARAESAKVYRWRLEDYWP